MGFLSTLLTLPVSGPLAGLSFIADKLHEAALKEEFDPDAIKRRLIALEASLEAGQIDEETYEAQELALLQRLRDARRFQQAGR
jgi:hypothetical protein